MKQIFLAIALLAFAQVSLSCDETCKRAKAETANNIKFAPYLNAKYCKETAADFLIKARKSLNVYKEKQLPTAHRGGANNIRNLLVQRKDWLNECDKYLELTEQGRIFRDKETTDKLIGALTSTADELQKLIKRPRNPEEIKDVVVAPAAAKFENLFEQMDAHYIDLQKRGML